MKFPYQRVLVLGNGGAGKSTFARAMGEFGATIMLAGNIPGKTQTMALAVYTAVQGGNREEAFQWAVIIVILSAAAILGVNFFERGKNTGKDDGF